MELRGHFAEHQYARPCQTFAVDSLKETAGQNAIIVLPCGVGKTYTGVLELCRETHVDGSETANFLIVSPSREIIHHWKDELIKYTTIPPASIAIIEDSGKDLSLNKIPGKVRIFLITYSLLRSKNDEFGTVISQLKKIAYRRVMCDECHHVPGEHTYKVLTTMKTKFPSTRWVGLTASPINSADKDCAKMIDLMGPQVDGGMTWKEMEQEQYIAPLQLTDVLCSFPPDWYDFYEELLRNRTIKDRTTLMRRMELFNPHKLAYVDGLVQKSIAEGHKFILFCDCVQLLREVANVMGCDYIDGSTSNTDRQRIFNELRNGSRQMLLVSRIADTGINLPNVDWAAQIDALGGSARQKTQRVGRVLRYEPTKVACFWDAVSTHPDHETDEYNFMNDRNEFLAHQGYLFRRDFVSSRESSDVLRQYPSRFLDDDVRAALMGMVKSYPHVKRECTKIYDEYKRELRAMKRPDRPKASAKRFKIAKDIGANNYRIQLQQFQDRRLQLRQERDAKLREAKADAVYEESEFDKFSENDDEVDDVDNVFHRYEATDSDAE